MVPHGSSEVVELRARIVELERKLEVLSGYCEDLEDRVTTMAVAKMPEARFPYWNWQLARGMDIEERRRLSFVLSTLDERVQGVEISEEFQKSIDPVVDATLYSREPLDRRAAMAVIEAVTGIRHGEGVEELLEAVQGQGMFQHLCRFLLKPT